MNEDRYCSKCGRKLIDQHCPVHLVDMEPLTIKDNITLLVEDIVNMDNELYKLERERQELTGILTEIRGLCDHVSNI